MELVFSVKIVMTSRIKFLQKSSIFAKLDFLSWESILLALTSPLSTLFSTERYIILMPLLFHLKHHIFFHCHRSTRNNLVLLLEASLEMEKKPQACNFIKKGTLVPVLTCEFCEYSKKTFFYRKPPVTASVLPGCLPK